MSGPAALSRAARGGRPVDLGGTPFAFLADPRVVAGLTLLQAGELVGDKLPMTPSRTSLPPLLGRAASGALVGAALYASGGRRWSPGAALGAASAVAAAYAGERLRSFVSKRTGVPDPLVALLEDGLTLLVGWRLAR